MDGTVDFGLLTLLPPIVIIVFALITKRTFEALMLGAIIAYVMSEGKGFVGAAIDGVSTVVTDNAWMWLTLGLFGSFVSMLAYSGGAAAIGNVIHKFANGPKRSGIMAWVLGVVIFMDDYLNILTVSAAMKDVSDKNKTPREMLAYIIDSTGAPVCVLIPLSTWAVFFSGVFDDEKALAPFVHGKMGLYIDSIPYMFYAWAAVIIVPLAVLKIIPPLFGMKKAYRRVAETGALYSEASKKFNQDTEAAPTVGNKADAVGIINFLAPMALIIVLTIVTEDLLVALIIAIVLQLVLYLASHKISFDVFSEKLVGGFANMMPMLFIVAGALVVKAAMDTIGLPLYVINAVQPLMSAAMLPAVTFVVVAGLSFITGSNWGIPAVTVPIIAPLAVAVDANVPMALAAIVSAGTFGSHACFYSDATVLTSQASGVDNMEHALTQIPYAVLGAIAAFILFVVFGFITA